jgi:predicted transcriptional regulator with HTH domain
MKISNEKKEKISEQILAFLYSINPKSIFTVEIARELARDEEFTKKLLLNLKIKGFINEIKKNPKGIKYLKRSRWVLSDKVYKAYKLNQTNNF